MKVLLAVAAVIAFANVVPSTAFTVPGVLAGNMLPHVPDHYEITKKDDNTILVEVVGLLQEKKVIEVTKNADGVFDLSPYTDDGMLYSLYLPGFYEPIIIGGVLMDTRGYPGRVSNY